MSFRPKQNNDVINFRDGIVFTPQTDTLRGEIQQLKAETDIQSKLTKIESHIVNNDEMNNKIRSLEAKMAPSDHLERRLQDLEARVEKKLAPPATRSLSAELHQRLDRIEQELRARQHKTELHERLCNVESALRAKFETHQKLRDNESYVREELRQREMALEAQMEQEQALRAKHEDELKAKEHVLKAKLEQESAARLEQELSVRLDRIQAALEAKLAQPADTSSHKSEALDKLSKLESKMERLCPDVWVKERMRLDKMQAKYNDLV